MPLRCGARGHMYTPTPEHRECPECVSEVRKNGFWMIVSGLGMSAAVIGLLFLITAFTGPLWGIAYFIVAFFLFGMWAIAYQGAKQMVMARKVVREGNVPEKKEKTSASGLPPQYR